MIEGKATGEREIQVGSMKAQIAGRVNDAAKIGAASFAAGRQASRMTAMGGKWTFLPVAVAAVRAKALVPSRAH